MSSAYSPTPAFAAPPMISSEIGWLLNQFAEGAPGLTHALVVSGDGMKMATTDAVDRDLGDQLAAAASGLLSLSNQCGGLLSLGGTDHITLRLQHGHVLCMRISEAAGLIVAAGLGTDLRVLAHRMTKFVGSVAHVLSPALRPGQPSTD